MVRHRSRTRTAAGVLAVALALAACTSSSDAAPDTSAPATTAATVESTVPTTAFDPDLDTVVDRDRPDEVRVVLAPEVVSSDGARIVIVDTATGDTHTLVAATALEIGQDPAAGERFGRIDVGGDRTVVFESWTGDAVTRINVLTAAGDRIDIGAGSHPAAHPDGFGLAFLGPRGVTVQWAPGSERVSGELVPGSVTGLRFSPSGDRLAVAWEDETDARVSVVSLRGDEFGPRVDLVPPTGRRWSLPSWIDRDHIAVLDTPVGVDGVGSLLTVSLVDGSIVATTRLESPIVDVDHVPGIGTALVVTADGRIAWVGGDAEGTLAEGPSRSARW